MSSPPAAQPGLRPRRPGGHSDAPDRPDAPDQNDRRDRRIALLATLVVHALLALIIWPALRGVPLQRAAPEDQAMVARFVPIALPAKLPQPVQPPPKTAPVTPRAPDLHVVFRKRVKQTPVKPPQDQASTPITATLYDATGQPLLPPSARSATAPPDYVQRVPSGDEQVMRHANPLPYQPTRLEKYFPPPGETAGGALVRRVADAVVKVKDVDLPRGIHLKCKTLLGIPIPDCSMPPAPPSAKDGDERLSMAPARPLTADPKPAKKPSVAACIALYRDGKPLVWGCPTDTPDRAVADELQRRANGSNRP